jgi:formylglycine-generating enzyme required for sulfatase activity
MSEGAQKASKGLNWRAPGKYPISDETPVTQITWNDAVAFCNWLSEQEGRRPWYQPDGKGGWFVAAYADGYRLPTEAEWEYACRAGTTTHYSFGDDKTQLERYGWFAKENGNKMQPVALKQPNPFGLFDMHGNALEWSHDIWNSTWYEKSPSDDPVATARAPTVERFAAAISSTKPPTLAVRTAATSPPRIIGILMLASASCARSSFKTNRRRRPPQRRSSQTSIPRSSNGSLRRKSCPPRSNSKR